MARNQIIQIIKNLKNIALIGHRDGDGDCYGALIGLYLALEKIGKNVRIYSERELPESFQFLIENRQVKFIDNYWKKADCLIIADTSGRNIISIPEVADKHLSDGDTASILIDHHEKGELVNHVNYAWVDQKYCSASELVLELVKGLKVNIDSEIATALLTGIDTDTTSFQTQNTTSRAFASASYLMDRGAKLYDIVQNNYFNHTIDSLRVRALVIDRLVINRKHGVAVSYLLNEDFNGASIEGASRMISQANFLNTIKGVKMIIFMSEIELGTIRVSLRTRDHEVDVSQIAKTLGGGGHIKAAGFLFNGHMRVNNGRVEIV